jgi:hypothetical protein
VSGQATATVEVLTAEVRVLMVGSRQVTLSVYGQLDTIDDKEIEPFGRVRARSDEPGQIYVVGRHKETGALARSSRPGGHLAIWHRIIAEAPDKSSRDICISVRVLQDSASPRERPIHDAVVARRPEVASWAEDRYEELFAEANVWHALPLIVLAGLR